MQEEAGLLSLLNQAKYLSLRHISEPEDNSLRLVVEEAVVDRTETVSTPNPTSPFAEIRKGAAPIKPVEGCRAFELQPQDGEGVSGILGSADGRTGFAPLGFGVSKSADLESTTSPLAVRTVPSGESGTDGTFTTLFASVRTVPSR
jgi:hypothetical protein